MNEETDYDKWTKEETAEIKLNRGWFSRFIDWNVDNRLQSDILIGTMASAGIILILIALV